MQEFIVSNLEDENDGDFSEGDLSLREAIANAESEDTITFDSTLSGGTITLALGELAIDKSLTIQGLGAENIIIDANANSRVFNIDDGNEDTQIDVALNSLAITGSRVEDNSEGELQNNGGGILNSENLEVNNADIYNNQATLEGGGIYSNGTLSVNNSEIFNNSVGDDRDRTTAGGGIYADGTLIVNNSAIYNNSGSGGFGIAVGGGIVSAGTATINQSTITGNSAEGRLNTAGGIENREGDLAITNSTISNNSSNLTGGIVNNSEGEVTVTSTIISNVGNQNITGNNFVSGGNNFISGEAVVGSRGGPRTISAEGFTDGENGDVVGTLENPIDPLLGELLGNGGITPTQALLEGSPAIDAGSNPNDLDTDQRGVGFDRTVGAGTDIGAFELQDGSTPEADALVVSTLEDENDGDFSEGDLSLREAIAIANEQEGTDTISFTESLSGGTIGLTENIEDPRGLGTINAELLITDSVEIDGLGANNLTLDGLNAGNGIFRIEGDTNVTVEGLNITNGSRQAFFFNDATAGGAVVAANDSSFILRDSIISNSRANSAGAISSGGNVEIVNSLITENESGGGQNPGGAVVVRGNLSVVNSTIAQNTGTGVTNLGTADITNSTIVDGIRLINPESTTITSSIVLQNSEEENTSSITSNLGQGITSGGNNLIANGDDITGFVESDSVGTGDNILDPLLGELQDNGGATPTIELLEGSPAIDAGSNPNNLDTDQRGSGFDRTVGAGTDIGAFEVQDAGNDRPEQPDVEVPDIETPQPEDVVNDPLEGTDGNDSLSGEGTNDDVISGGAGHDTLNGNDGHDNISGGAGDDLIFGGTGDDLLDGNDGHNNISGDNGHDTLFGGEGNETLTGGDGNDLLVGAAGHDSLVGSKGHDVINGEAGDDFINGGRGDDLLTGGAGGDTLVGGAGHDVFVLESSDSHDTIVDFESGGDRLQLSESLTIGQLSIVDNESNTGSLILDSNNHDAVVASVENIHAADLEIHLFC